MIAHWLNHRDELLSGYIVFFLRLTQHAENLFERIIHSSVSIVP
jgi:hypothetical protein